MIPARVIFFTSDNARNRCFFNFSKNNNARNVKNNIRTAKTPNLKKEIYEQIYARISVLQHTAR